jgi:hypothetical protein
MIKHLLFLTFIFNLSLAWAQETPECVSIKKSKNSPERSINIVIVPSDFGSDMDHFESKVRDLWSDISQIDPYSSQVDTMNVIIAKIPSKSNSYCEVSKENDRILNCNWFKAAGQADHCFKGPQRYVITIHNSDHHAGSGLVEGAASTLAKSASGIIPHELGHAIFNLADEYTYVGKANGPNCAKQSSCAPWQDLIDAGLATCQTGCPGNSKFTSTPNIMRTLEVKDFGHVNNRLICCRFKKLTGEYPNFCDQYSSVGSGLDKFCR